MDVESRFLWFPREQTHAVHELFLQSFGQVVLLAEEDYTALTG
jgi:hypothetical protein